MRSERPGFAEAYDELFVAAFGLAGRIVGDAAEDVAAETMVRAYVHWSRIGDKEWRAAWVLRVATNLSLKMVKRKPYYPARPSAAAAQDEMEAALLRGSLAVALRALPRRQREVVAMRYLADASEADVARALGVRPVTVRTHLRRGLAALRLSTGLRMEGNIDGSPS